MAININSKYIYYIIVTFKKICNKKWINNKNTYKMEIIINIIFK